MTVICSTEKGTEPNKRRLDLHIQLESYVDQIVKGCGYERDNKYIEQNMGDGDLNAATLCRSTF